MKYTTHLTTSLSVCLPVLVTTGNFTMGNVAAVALGSLLPDIDEPRSWIGRRTRGISDLIHMYFGHRGITHSLLGVILAMIPILLLVLLTSFSLTNGSYLILGYFLHLIEDSFSKKGIKWLLPLSDKSFQSGFNVIYYSYNSIAEDIILLLSAFIMFFEFYLYGMPSFGDWTLIDIVNVMTSLIEKIISSLINGFIEQMNV